ncbi:MAG: UpxY family transcription antiterminator [Terriglobia bacterium]
MLKTIDSAAGDGTAPSYGWHALYTRHQHEKVVAGILTHKGVEVFLPLYTAAHRWKDRTKQLSLPLFPCYVFVRDGLDRQLQILTTPGVFSFVGGSRPAQIPETDMEALFKMVASSLRVEPHPFLKCGDWVRVKFGPLEGIEGILLRKKNLFRLVLSVEMLQKAVAVEVDISMVERVARPDVRNCIPGVASEVSGRSSRAFAV